MSTYQAPSASPSNHPSWSSISIAPYCDVPPYVQYVPAMPPPFGAPSSIASQCTYPQAAAPRPEWSPHAASSAHSAYPYSNHAHASQYSTAPVLHPNYGQAQTVFRQYAPYPSQWPLQSSLAASQQSFHGPEGTFSASPSYSNLQCHDQQAQSWTYPPIYNSSWSSQVPQAVINSPALQRQAQQPLGQQTRGFALPDHTSSLPLSTVSATAATPAPTLTFEYTPAPGGSSARSSAPQASPPIVMVDIPSVPEESTTAFATQSLSSAPPQQQAASPAPSQPIPTPPSSPSPVHTAASALQSSCTVPAIQSTAEAVHVAELPLIAPPETQATSVAPNMTSLTNEPISHSPPDAAFLTAARKLLAEDQQARLQSVLPPAVQRDPHVQAGQAEIQPSRARRPPSPMHREPRQSHEYGRDTAPSEDGRWRNTMVENERDVLPRGSRGSIRSRQRVKIDDSDDFDRKSEGERSDSSVATSLGSAIGQGGRMAWDFAEALTSAVISTTLDPKRYQERELEADRRSSGRRKEGRGRRKRNPRSPKIRSQRSRLIESDSDDVDWYGSDETLTRKGSRGSWESRLSLSRRGFGMSREEKQAIHRQKKAEKKERKRYKKAMRGRETSRDRSQSRRSSRRGSR